MNIQKEDKSQAQQTITIETLNDDKEQLISPQEWIYRNIVQQAQNTNKNWRNSYLGKLGIGNKGPMNGSVVRKESTELNINNSLINNELQVELSLSDKTGAYMLNFLTRTNQDVRNNYIQKLIKTGIMQTSPAKKHQTSKQMTIFDWDDTILCTTYLGSYGFIDLPSEVTEQLAYLNDSGAKLLQKAVSYGDTFIITNAAQGWVEYSSKLYMPKVHDVIFENQIVVISARAGYEDLFPGDCSKWKVEAFKDIKKKFDSNIITNIICLGDSHIEIDAGHVLAKQQKKIKIKYFEREFNYSLIKTIKFRENPKPDELVKQQDLVHDKFEQIYSNLKNLTIRLEKSKTNPS